MIFAITTKYILNASQDTEFNSDEHIMYFSRAWKLSMGDVALLEHPNIQQVQVEGLSTFYLMMVGQVNRCVVASSVLPCQPRTLMYFQVLEDFRHINTIIHYHGFKSAK
jgi:hypothetical protein